MTRLDTRRFEDSYRALVLAGDYFEDKDYYVREKPRYFHTVELIVQALSGATDLSQLQLLEIGGGQISLLMRSLFGCSAVIADVSDRHSAWITSHGCEFRTCDLLHDDLPDRDRFDLVVICEVIEHLPVPPHQILQKVGTWMKGDGMLFVTTPNLYRLRNVIRLALGMRVFDHFLIPNRGQSIGHPFEYSAEHLSWQITQAGFTEAAVAYKQLGLTGATRRARIGRLVASPLLVRQKLRDSLVATARKRGELSG